MWKHKTMNAAHSGNQDDYVAMEFVNANTINNRRTFKVDPYTVTGEIKIQGDLGEV